MKTSGKYILTFLFALFLSAHGLDAQTDNADVSLEDRQMAMAVSTKIQSFIDELEDLSSAIQNAPPDVYPDIIKRYNSEKLRWNTYYQSYQGFIADHEELMQDVADYGLLEESLKASMDELKTKMEARADFDEAEKFIGSQDSVYVDLYKRANTLSATQRTAGELEKLKGKEQLVFAQIQDRYDKAKAAVELIPSLEKKMNALDEKYIALKSTSSKIQEIAFKPLVQRIKDYLLGFAAVAVVMMFLSMVQNKISAAKQMKENAKKMMETMKKNNDDMPCI